MALLKSVQCLDQAIKLDPDYAAAYAGLASAHATAALWGLWPPGEVWPKARAAAAKALAIDDSLAEAHASLATVKAWYEYDWAGAERHFRRALELNPGDAGIHASYAGTVLWATGRVEEGEAEVRRAQELDPLSIAVATTLAWAFFHSRQFDRALVESQRILELDPTHIEAWLVVGATYSLKSMFPEAIAAFQKARALGPNVLTALGLLGWAYGLSGARREAEDVLAELNELRKQRYASMYIAWVHLGLGEKQQALDWMEKAYMERDAMAPYIKVGPSYDPLRSEPRFVALLEKMGLR